jgi:hypothetical protein
MKYEKAAQLGALLAKDYSEDLFKLLVNYRDISASEAASRLSLHIRTAQDFLDNLAELEIVQKTEVFEKKRPYFRYNLVKTQLPITVDLSVYKKENPGQGLSRLVREKAENRANFTLARTGDEFSSVTIWEGEGRDHQEHKISLTSPQGKFLFHLPFPKSRPMSIADILEKADIGEEYTSEIQNIVDELIRQGVIEVLT